MRESDAIAVELDDVTLPGSRERGRGVGAGQTSDELRRRMREECRSQERSAPLNWERSQPVVDQGRQRQRQRFARLEPDGPAEKRPTELEGKERIAAGQLVDPAHLRAGQVQAQTVAQESVNRSCAQRSNLEPPDTILRDRPIEVEGGASVAAPPPRQDGNRFLAQPPGCEGERESGGLVEPLNVVDGNQQRASQR